MRADAPGKVTVKVADWFFGMVRLLGVWPSQLPPDDSASEIDTRRVELPWLLTVMVRLGTVSPSEMAASMRSMAPSTAKSPVGSGLQPINRVETTAAVATA